MGPFKVGSGRWKEKKDRRRIYRRHFPFKGHARKGLSLDETKERLG